VQHSNKKEATWRFKEAVTDLIEDQGRCIKQLVLSARRNAKFLSSLEKIAQYTAKIAIQSAKTKAVKI